MSVVDVAMARSGVLQVTINRPHQRNSISGEVARGLSVVLAACPSDPDVRAIVLTGAGDRAFSAGYDIHELTQLPEDERGEQLEFFGNLLWRLFASPVPVVAAVNGGAWGGGAMLAACCDLRVVGPGSSFKFAAVKYGGIALTWLLDALVGGAWARDLLLTGRELSGEETCRIGLATRWCDQAESVLAAALDVASQLAEHDVAAVRVGKRLLTEHASLNLSDRYVEERAAVARLVGEKDPRDMFKPFLVSHLERALERS